MSINKKKTPRAPILLRERGLRATGARQAILAFLDEACGHPTADEIHRGLRRARLGRATVFRTLQLLVRIGALQKLECGDGRARYELVGESARKPHHHHLVCQTCGAIVDYDRFVAEERETIERIVARIEKKHGFVVSGHTMQFAGQCARCRPRSRRKGRD